MRQFNLEKWAPTIVTVLALTGSLLWFAISKASSYGEMTAGQAASNQAMLTKMTEAQQGILDLRTKLDSLGAQVATISDMTRRIGALEGAQNQLTQQLTTMAAQLAADQQALVDMQNGTKIVGGAPARR